MNRIEKLKKRIRQYAEIVYGRKRADEVAEKIIRELGLRTLISAVVMSLLIIIAEIEISLALLFLIIVSLLTILPLKKLYEEKKYMEETLSDGLEALINELSLLLSAGLSPEASMMRIAGDCPRYAAIERLFEHIEEESELGLSIYVALASFAKLYNSNYLYRFNSALASSGRTGARNLENNLNELKSKIINEKRSGFKRKAETLSTKLLLPLMLSLLGICGMILFPIFSQLGI